MLWCGQEVMEVLFVSDVAAVFGTLTLSHDINLYDL